MSTKKDVQAGKIMDMTIRIDKKTNKRTGAPGIISELWKEFDPRREGERVVTEQQQESFLEGYRKIQPTAQLFYSSDVGELPKDTMPFQITKRADNYLNTLENNISKQDVISGYMKILPLEDGQVKSIESSTRQQAKSSCWVEQRKGRITSSKFKDICITMETISKSRANKRPKTTHMVAELVFGSSSVASLPAIKWETDNEDKELREFHALAFSKHENCKMVKSGLWILKDKPYIAASPDGLMTCDCCQSACVEIKCPFSIREYAVEDKWHETDFLECVNNNIQLKRSRKYYYQITGQMAVTGMFKTFFIVWTTRRIFVELIKYDLEFWTRLLHNLEIF
ncbi:Chromatin modification-related png2 [Paramuricea clavata]|uniref:Chromatin modification-related png2 n=1 Tax=Paramuricea clavata TaxID=317549 RepID=A0A7D9DET5_PARCT|nr:Chromatin modification-related png2 [Paramuricea clavata]